MIGEKKDRCIMHTFTAGAPRKSNNIIPAQLKTFKPKIAIEVHITNVVRNVVSRLKSARGEADLKVPNEIGSSKIPTARLKKGT